jgi:hypothetical protein
MPPFRKHPKAELEPLVTKEGSSLVTIIKNRDGFESLEFKAVVSGLKSGYRAIGKRPKLNLFLFA